MRWSIVDQNGRFWETSTQFLSETFHAQPQSKDCLDFLVRNLGCIAIGFVGHSCIIRVAPAYTQYQTFARVGQIVEEVAPARVALSSYDTDWRNEIFADSRAALEHLLALISKTDKPSEYFQRSRRLNSLDHGHFLQPLIDLWRAEAGEIDLIRHSETIIDRTDDKFLTVYIDPGNGRLKFSQFGSSWIVYKDRRWLTKCVGQRVEDQPDFEYGKWVAATYRESFLTNQPVLMDADVVVKDPTGGGDRRIQYSRLTFPVRAADGTKHMLCTSCPDTGVDLRPPVN